MTRLIKIIFAILISATGLNAQNVFDESHSADFADFLFKSGEYDKAAQEYLRLSFLSNNKTYKLRLLESYRLAGMPDKEYEAFYKLFDNPPFNDKDFAAEYLKMDISLNLPNDLIKKSSLLSQPELKTSYQLSAYLISGEWQKAYDFANQLQGNIKNTRPVSDLIPLTQEAVKIRLKKPWIASLMSTVVPGSGKIYSGYFWDGIMSFLFSASNAFLAYRGFSKYGTKSGLGWTFAGMGTFFYLGNIYGSYKAAIRKNNERKHKIYHKTKDIIDRSL